MATPQVPFERRAPREEGTALARLERGAWHGAWTVAIGALPAAFAYVARWGMLELPWHALGAQLATFVPICGACYGAGIAYGEHVASARRSRTSMIALPALFGALGGIAPGAFAAEHFGRIPAPYFGTAEILVTGVLSFFLLGAALLRSDGVRLGHAAIALSLALFVPILPGVALYALVPETTWMVDDLVLDSADVAPSLGLFGAVFGALVGLFFGGLLGLARALLTRSEPVVHAITTARISAIPRDPTR